MLLQQAGEVLVSDDSDDDMKPERMLHTASGVGLESVPEPLPAAEASAGDDAQGHKSSQADGGVQQGRKSSQADGDGQQVQKSSQADGGVQQGRKSSQADGEMQQVQKSSPADGDAQQGQKSSPADGEMQQGGRSLPRLMERCSRARSLPTLMEMCSRARSCLGRRQFASSSGHMRTSGHRMQQASRGLTSLITSRSFRPQDFQLQKKQSLMACRTCRWTVTIPPRCLQATNEPQPWLLRPTWPRKPVMWRCLTCPSQATSLSAKDNSCRLECPMASVCWNLLRPDGYSFLSLPVLGCGCFMSAWVDKICRLLPLQHRHCLHADSPSRWSCLLQVMLARSPGKLLTCMLTDSRL